MEATDQYRAARDTAPSLCQPFHLLASILITETSEGSGDDCIEQLESGSGQCQTRQYK